ncbi:MAG: site-2 protease family protein [Candidatus Angelobacter sp.]
MSSFTSELIQNCARCARPLPPGALECPECRTLVHSDQMEQLAAHARALEAHGEFAQAANRWMACLPLLPQQSQQAAWIRDHVRELQAGQSSPRPGKGPSDAKNQWAKRLGPLAPIALLLAKFKTFFLAIFKFKFLFSFAAYIAIYWAMFGPKFGIGFALLVFFHEMGHFIDIKRRGLPVDMPVFLPGLGAYVRWQALGVTLETRAAVSLAGPLAGFLSSAVCALIWYKTGNGLWGALARTGAWFNALNLAPICILDGGSAAYALSKVQRAMILVVSAALGYALGESVFFLVTAGAAWRLFTHDAPEEPSSAIAAYFVAVLTALAMMLWLVPAHGNGLR